MPLPLKKLKFLANVPNMKKEVDIISKRKKSTSALWVAIYNGLPICPTFKTKEQVMEYMKFHPDIQYNISKLHIQGDSELISKIKEKYNV